MHPHSYDLLRGAGFVVMEQQQSAPIGGRCRPDLTILDTHRDPLAFIEIVRSNRPSNSLRVAEELGIPLFTILAPHRRSLVPGLRPSRPWWDFDPSLPTDAKQQMYFMEQVADELMRRNGDGDSTWANLDMMLDDDGKLVFASFRGSPPDLAGATFPRTGDLIVAELCSWGCDNAMEVLQRERHMDQQSAMVSLRETLEQDLGRILLGAIRGAKDGTSRFVVPVGSEEVHVEMSLNPLNPHVGASDPTVLNLMAHVVEATDKVRTRHRRKIATSIANEREITALTEMSGPQTENWVGN
ncbi:MAG: hypothetical protein OXC99_01230 [Chloroflexi bacterium]|nr:hypothetical protein [Chloroflexota bacterium]